MINCITPASVQTIFHYSTERKTFELLIILNEFYFNIFRLVHYKIYTFQIFTTAHIKSTHWTKKNNNTIIQV